MRKSFLVLAVAAALSVAVFAASSAPSASKTTMTVGAFAKKVAKAIGSPTESESAALAVLKQAGVRDLSKSLSAQMTEADAVKILGDLGVKVISRTPDRPISLAKADQLIASVSLGSSAASVAPAQDEFPSECIDVKNRGKCVTCCKLAFGCDPETTCDFAKGCEVFCRQNITPGPPSPDEPLP
jgi:hypothetical protein